MRYRYKILVVDYANLLYRSYWSAKSNEVPGLSVFRFIQSLFISMRQTCCNTLLLAGESFSTLKRTKYDSSYKSNRKQPDNKDFIIFSHCLRNMLKSMNIEIIHYPGYEGDDVIATLCKIDKEDEIFIMSIDKDLRQLLEGERVRIVLPDTQRSLYTEKMFCEEHGFGPEKYYIYKALVGDKSDAINGVYGIGPAHAKDLVISDSWYDSIKNLEKEKYYQFKHALRLITLDPTVPIKAFGPYLACKACSVKQLRYAKKIFTKCYGEQLVDGVMNECRKLLGVENMRDKIIAIDFDGTLVKNEWPNIGAMREDIFDAALKEQKKGARLILWTCRIGDKLEDAIKFCKEKGLVFDGVNENMPNVLTWMGGDSRKIFADEYWDDRNRILVFD